MKNNHPIPHNRFKKTAIRYRTPFHLPARRIKQEEVRKDKESKFYPMPIQKLRPIVRCPTIRHNKRERMGRGFTPEECREAGFNHQELQLLGVSIDLRRRNHNKEAFDQNVERVKTYMSRLVIFKDRKEARESGLKQHRGVIMPLVAKKSTIGSMKICDIKSEMWAADKVVELIAETKHKREKK